MKSTLCLPNSCCLTLNFPRPRFDIIRIIEDVVPTFNQNSIKASGVNYSVPRYETTRNCVADPFSIALFCGRGKARKGIFRKGADEYGELGLKGRFVDLVLSQNILSEFHGDSYPGGRSRSLPNLVISLEICTGSCHEAGTKSMERVAAHESLRGLNGPTFHSQDGNRKVTQISNRRIFLKWTRNLRGM